MNIFLTGGTGFIGRNLQELLSGHDIIAPSHQDLELTDPEAVSNFFRKHPIDVVIHSAVKPGHRNAKDPTQLLHNNTLMFFNIARQASRFKKMIFIGSGAVYDHFHYKPKMKEEYFDVNVPTDDHGSSKYICAKYIEKTENITELRVFGIFGKYEDYAIRFISNAICKTLFDLPVTLRQNRLFDYLYVDDLAPVIEHFINNKAMNSAYNVTPDKAIDLYSLAQKVVEVSGKDLPILVSESGYGVEYSGDNSRLKKEMPELTFTPIDEAIRQLYDWYADNIHLINKEFLLVDK